MLPGWFILCFTRASPSLSPPWCRNPDSSRSVPHTGTDEAHLLLQTGCKLISSTFSRKHSFPAGLTRKDKCRSRLSSQVLKITAGETEVLFCSLGKCFSPVKWARELCQGAPLLWQCLKGCVRHECVQRALQMPPQPLPKPVGDLRRGMPGPPAPSCSALSEMGLLWWCAEMWTLAPGNCGERGKHLWCSCARRLLQ